MTGLEVQQKPDAIELRPIYVLFGDEEFLRGQAWQAIRRRVLGSDDEFGIGRFDGPEATIADVLDELATLPFFGKYRLVMVDDADPFVTQYRPLLEKYAESPVPRGVLVLSVKTWPSNTRLAKIVQKTGVAVECRLPPQLPAWCQAWAQQRYGKKLATDAADLLVELSGGGLGQLDTELNKLTAYVGERKEIRHADVDQLVAAGRVETIWKLIGIACQGETAQALEMLDRLLVAGEAPVALLAAMATQLRRLAKAARLMLDGTPLSPALAEAGIPAWPRAQDEARAQLRHLGRDRLLKLFDWLLETDLGLKGSSELLPRTQLERLLVRVSAKSE
jgi:DNA polymerase-3 subunit delta